MAAQHRGEIIVTIKYIIYIGITVTVVIGLVAEYKMRAERRHRK